MTLWLWIWIIFWFLVGGVDAKANFQGNRIIPEVSHRSMIALLQDCPQPDSGKKVAMNEYRETEA